jgi:hypothetical protein
VRKIATKTKCQELVELLGFDNVYEAIDGIKSSQEREINEGVEGLDALFG